MEQWCSRATVSKGRVLVCAPGGSFGTALCFQ